MQTTPENNSILLWISGILAAINSVQIIIAAWRKLKPEIKKLEMEGDSELVDATNKTLEGARTSSAILLDRINELKQELADEKKERKDEMDELNRQRDEDREYFKRRIKELDREARDYRVWAAQLARQVIEAGKIPVPFVQSPSDSEKFPAVSQKDKKE